MSEAIVILTGAGVSADSGLATFRGTGGLWEGHIVEDVATPEAWERDPALVWRFHQLLRAQMLEAQPNAAHRALAHLAESQKRAGAPPRLFRVSSRNRKVSLPAKEHADSAPGPLRLASTLPSE